MCRALCFLGVARYGDSMSRVAFPVWVAVAGLAGSALLVALILRAQGGFTYTLDDPYIHLALAEGIADGGYGLNPGEFAAPSSSILWPFLMALMLVLGLGAWGPLVVALLGQAATGAMMGRALGPSGWVALPLALLAVQAVNGFALPLTGMEHTLHAAASVAVILGLARGDAPRWLVPVIWATAALRFEGFALAGAAALALVATGHRRAGLVALAGLLALALGFALSMMAMGLPPLPSSVLVKSDLSAAAVSADGRGAFVALVVNALVNLREPAAVLLLASALALSVLAWQRPGVRVYALPAITALLAHLVLGRFGWFGRYEVYAAAVALTALALALRGRVWVVAGAMAAFGAVYLDPLMRTPAAALAVHQQHEQMHRFATEFFARPVAVNDLGFVAWNNDSRVVDLWGLGSDEARRLTAQGGRTPAMMQQLTAGRADFAMIYDPAFPRGVPPTWCRIAALDTSLGATAWDSVAFYLIDRAQESDMRAALAAFAPTLPAGALLTLFDCET